PVHHCRSSGPSVLPPAGCSRPDARERHARKEAWRSFPKVGAAPGVKPFETFGKDSGIAQKAGTRDDGPTGPATPKSPEGEIAETVRSAPGRDPRMRALYGFRALWQGKAALGAPWRSRESQISRLQYLFV